MTLGMKSMPFLIFFIGLFILILQFMEILHFNACLLFVNIYL